MFKNLENYLEEISHFLSGREEREEILSEIRSHILEKAEQEGGPTSEASLDKVIAAYGKPRWVAEKYLDGRPVIASTYQRHLFRYASLLFAVHFAFVMFSVVFKRSFTIFPFLYVPDLSSVIVDAIMYLPMAFLADFGAVALVLYLITRSGKEIKLPWPKFASDLDELQEPDAKTLAARIWNMVEAVIMVALSAWAFRMYARFHTLFVAHFDSGKFQPLFKPAPGRTLSLVVLIMLAAGTATLLIKMFSSSRRLACWVNIAADTVALVLIGVVLRQQHDNLFAVDVPARLATWVYGSLTVTLIVVALFVAIDLVVNLIRLGRKRLAR
jgi:ABC-type multidrug transport system fused ATPase/permease subunit